MSNLPCVHLEALINPRGEEPKFESTHKYAGYNIDKAYYESGAGFVIPEGIKNRSYEFQFRSKLEKAGLEPVKIDILVLRYVYEMNFKDIADELGIKSIGTTYDLYSKALETIKKRGLK